MILGHERQIKYLETVLKKNRMAHAYLFYGPEHVGKLTIAKSFAKALRCQKKIIPISRDRGESVSLFGECGECVSCAGIENDADPEVLRLDALHTLISEKETRKEIPIKDIRELKRIFSLAPLGNAWRVVIINEAEKMSAEAANAFLKLLEEPGAQTLILLVTSSRELLFSTIMSRTQQIQFSLVPHAEINGFLEKKRLPAEERKELCRIARGRPGVLHTLLEDKDALAEERKFLAGVSTGIEEGDIPAAFRIHEHIASDPELRVKYIECAMEILRAKLLLANTPETALFFAKKLKNALRMRTLIETTNVNPRLCLDAFTLGVQSGSKAAAYK
ncbi:MAG: DNA polymerase III subunit delta' [Parcubacteria group bacterium Gr01-1014_33]|nr:MAG: DNA polymerase III subunit delta' [Parcubacteria group bacterium Gr01-1014_33]